MSYLGDGEVRRGAEEEKEKNNHFLSPRLREPLRLCEAGKKFKCIIVKYLVLIILIIFIMCF
jgi:uncharacterized integral membrane protein